MAARQHVEQHFQWTSFVEKYEALYTSLIKQAQAKG
jgi:hypothetical protein